MIDEMSGSKSGAQSAASARPESSAPAGFCQECGRGLTIGSLRRVGAGVFCPECAHRAPASPGWQPVEPAPGAGRPSPYGQRTGSKPLAAALLGMIPGVGAMYNSQYAKGLMHLVVFGVLIAMAENISDVFYWFVWGWVFYQAFDAYHTAQARRDGQPLPDPFGWNDMSGRFMGFPSGSPQPFPGGKGAPQYPSPPNESADVQPLPNDPYAYARRPPASPTVASFNGENPYTSPFVSPAPGMNRSETGTSMRPPTQVPYSPIYTGPEVPGSVMPTPLVGTRRFPVGALWLIGLGLLFLIWNVVPGWRVSGQWIAPLSLFAVACWSTLHRWPRLRNRAFGLGPDSTLVRVLTVPAMLFTIAILLSLQAAHVLSLAHSWPLLLVIWGMFLLAQRALPQPSPRNTDLPISTSSVPYPGTIGDDSHRL